MFHGIKYLIVSLVFSHLGFWSGNLFLIAPFPDLCLLVPFSKEIKIKTEILYPLLQILVKHLVFQQEQGQRFQLYIYYRQNT